MAQSKNTSKRHTPKLTKISGGKEDKESMGDKDPSLELGDFSPQVNQHLLKGDVVFTDDVRTLAQKGADCERLQAQIQGLLVELQAEALTAQIHNKIGQLAQLGNLLGEEAVIRIAQCIESEGDYTP